MRYVIQPSGRFVEYFNDSIVYCNNSQTTYQEKIIYGGCPAGLECSNDTQVFEYPGTCVCGVWRGRTGANCEWFTMWGMAVLGIAIVLMVLNAVAMGLTAWEWMRRRPVWKWADRQLILTLGLVSVAFLFMGIQFVYQVVLSFRWPVRLRVVDYISTLGAFLFSYWAQLNVSFIWLQVSVRVMKIHQHSIDVYGVVVFVYILALACLCLALLALREPVWVYVSIAPAALFIAVMYVFAWVTIRRLLQNSIAFNSKYGEASATMEAKIMRTDLNNISYTSLMVGLSNIVILILSILNMTRVFTNDPSQTSNALAQRIVWACGFFTNVAVLNYCRIRFIRLEEKIKRETSRSTFNDDRFANMPRSSVVFGDDDEYMLFSRNPSGVFGSMMSPRGSPQSVFQSPKPPPLRCMEIDDPITIQQAPAAAAATPLTAAMVVMV